MLNEEGKIVRNKARIGCKEYSQIEGIDVNETFGPVVRLEAMWMFLDVAISRGYTVCQMDVKSSFLNGNLN